jgi:hypothetical protein
MNVATKRRPKRTGPPSSEALREARDAIVRATAALSDGPKRVDWELLDEREQRELVELTREEQMTDAERGRWERLVGRGTGDEKFFEKLRQRAELVALAAEAKRQAVRRRVTRAEERGLLAEIGTHIEKGLLYYDHAALLLAVMVSLESGKPLRRGQTLDRAADGVTTLTIDANVGLLDPARLDSDLGARWKQLLAHLEKNNWVVVTRLGPLWTLALGGRTLRALGASKK